jgi:uncharacterized protein YxjI
MRFYVKQKVFSLKDRFKILDEAENEAYQVSGRMFSFKNKLELQDMSEKPLMRAEKKLFSFFPTYFLFDLQGNKIATVKKKFGLRANFMITIGNEVLDVDGSLFGYNFSVFRNGSAVVTISKKVISWGDSYEIDILDEREIDLYLFLVIIIDQVLHEQKNKAND